jgi:hypothetical protein
MNYSKGRPLTHMVPKVELSRRQQRQGKRIAREVRSTLIEADGDARPTFLWRMMAVGLHEEGAEERAQRRVELGFRWLANTVVALVLVLFVVDTVSGFPRIRATHIALLRDSYLSTRHSRL